MKSAFCTASQYGYFKNFASIVTQNAAIAATTATTATTDSHRHARDNRRERSSAVGSVRIRLVGVVERPAGVPSRLAVVGTLTFQNYRGPFAGSVYHPRRILAPERSAASSLRYDVRTLVPTTERGLGPGAALRSRITTEQPRARSSQLPTARHRP